MAGANQFPTPLRCALQFTPPSLKMFTNRGMATNTGMHELDFERPNQFAFLHLELILNHADRITGCERRLSARSYSRAKHPQYVYHNGAIKHVRGLLASIDCRCQSTVPILTYREYPPDKLVPPLQRAGHHRKRTARDKRTRGWELLQHHLCGVLLFRSSSLLANIYTSRIY